MNSNKENDLNMKLSIVKKALLQEREIVKQKEVEISSLKENLIQKDEIISNLKEKNKILSENLIKEEPKKFFDSFLNKKNSELLSEELQDQLKIENEKLMIENKAYHEQIEILSTQISQLTEELNRTKEILNKKITNLTNCLNEKTNELGQNQIKIEILQGMSQKLEVEKVLLENQLREFKKNEEDIKEYKNTNENLKQTINQLVLSVTDLKSIVEKLGDEKIQLENKLKNKEGISKEYTFHGLLYIPNTDKMHYPKFMLKYNFEDYIVRTEEKEEIRNIDLRDIIEIVLKKKTKNLIILKFKEGNDIIEKNIIFNLREIESILNYYKEMKLNNRLLNINLIGESLSNY